MAEAMWQSLTSRKIILGSLGVVVLALAGLWLADPDAFPTGPFTEAEQPSPAPPADDRKPPASQAERIAHLERSIEEQRKYLAKLNAQFNDPKSEYNTAEKSFEQLDTARETAKQAIQDLKAAGKAAEAAAREVALKDIESRWQQERDRFNLAIQERKTLRESIAAATRQLQESERALDRASGASPSAIDPSSAPSTSKVAEGPRATTTEKNSSSSPSTPSLLPVPSSSFSLASASPSSSAEGSSPKTPAEKPEANVSREVERAREEAKVKEDAAKKAENRAQSISERIETLSEDIKATKSLLDTARRMADREQQTKSQLESELQQKISAKAPATEIQGIADRMAAAQRSVQKALDEVRSTTDHLHELQTELSRLQAAQIRALHDADAKKQAAEAAEERIAYLQNPFRPRNIVHWLLHHGPRLLLIAVGIFVFHRLSRAFSRRVVQIMSQGTSKRGTRHDRENRAQTLVGVFNSSLSLLILGGGSLMMLDEVGIPIVPLMGGAAVSAWPSPSVLKTSSRTISPASWCCLRINTASTTW
jgi:hypothetical protein